MSFKLASPIDTGKNIIHDGKLYPVPRGMSHNKRSIILQVGFAQRVENCTQLVWEVECDNCDGVGYLRSRDFSSGRRPCKLCTEGKITTIVDNPSIELIEARIVEKPKIENYSALDGLCGDYDADMYVWESAQATIDLFYMDGEKVRKRTPEVLKNKMSEVSMEAASRSLNREPTSKPQVTDEEILTTYSKWLEEHGYMDSDWWSEQPTAVDRFLKQQDGN